MPERGLADFRLKLCLLGLVGPALLRPCACLAPAQQPVGGKRPEMGLACVSVSLSPGMLRGMGGGG